MSAVFCCCCFLPNYFGTNDNETSCSTQEPVEGCEEGAKEAKSSEAKVTVADLLCRTLHSFWLCFHSCPPFPLSTRSTLALSTIPPSSRLSFSFFFSRTHTPSFLVFPLSPRINPCQAPLTTHCTMVNQTRRTVLAALPHSRRLVFAASSALPHPRCLIRVALPLLSHPRCPTLAANPRPNSPSSHPSHC